MRLSRWLVKLTPGPHKHVYDTNCGASATVKEGMFGQLLYGTAIFCKCGAWKFFDI